MKINFRETSYAVRFTSILHFLHTLVVVIFPLPFTMMKLNSKPIAAGDLATVASSFAGPFEIKFRRVYS